MNQTLAREWQYARAYTSEEGKAEALPSYIERHNRERPHVTCDDLPPMSRIGGVDNVMALNNWLPSYRRNPKEAIRVQSQAPYHRHAAASHVGFGVIIRVPAYIGNIMRTLDIQLKT